MKKIILSLFLCLFLGMNLAHASSDWPGRDTSSAYIEGDCVYVVKQHYLLWGLVSWESAPELAYCGCG